MPDGRQSTAEAPHSSASPATVVPHCGLTEAKRCGNCGELRENTRKKLSEIMVGHEDSLEERVEEICWKGPDYTVYRSTHGVSVHLSDCLSVERDQRRLLASAGSKLCQLRFLASQMATSHLSFLLPFIKRKGGFYDHEMAQAIVLVLEGRKEDANGILDVGLELAVDRLVNENRVRYLLACFFAAGFLSVFTAALIYLLGNLISEPFPLYLFGLTAIFGAAGATCSLSVRIRDLALVPCRQSVMNYVMGSLRVFLGFSGGIVLLLLLSAGPLQGFGNSLGLVERVPDGDAFASWPVFALVGFLAGFAERLVPNLMQNMESRVETAAASSASQGRTK
ncbi:hypothetical protein [Falsiroseomonas sp. E2-1-a20]|uniref:hypothetical protein n=1 Tax=Falsiroseomonas sp. E2-1-a20 TaxID=3239300 RepID=UPI003F30A527